MHSAPTRPVSGFDSTGLSPALLAVLSQSKLHTPTPIQAKAIPVTLTGADVIGIAQTGTGKTLAFGLPILDQLLRHPAHKALILVPTRELALQVEESLRSFCRTLPARIRTVSLIGGAPIHRQTRELSANPRIIVATPGRLRDHLEQGRINLSEVTTLVLDEADRMLDMGFAPQIKFVCSKLPQKRQTLLFSATLAPEIANLARSLQQNPVRIEVAPAGTSATKITQELCYVPHHEKADVLKTLLDQHAGTVLVFSRTKHGASKLAKKVDQFGHRAAEIHSNRSLGQRRHALEGFKSGRYRVLVATDVASRGIDVKDIQLVINFDLPDASEDYVHRIGRTGRAGKPGHAISLATPDQQREVRAIERLIGKSLPLSNLSATAPQPSAPAPRRDRRERPSRHQRNSTPHFSQPESGGHFMTRRSRQGQFNRRQPSGRR